MSSTEEVVQDRSARRAARSLAALVVVALTAMTWASFAHAAGALDGEYFQAPDDPLSIVSYGPSDPAGCSLSGASTIPFSGSGPITGPYPGTITVTGSFGLGAQSGSIPPDPDPIYGFPAKYGDLTSVTGTFTITSGSTTISGTITGFAPDFPSLGWNIGSCYGTSEAVALGYTALTSGTLIAWDANLYYTATISGPSGTTAASGGVLFRQRQTCVVSVSPLYTGCGFTGPVMSFYSATPPTDDDLDKTAPSVGTPALSLNPKGIGESSALSATASDALSGVVAGEYYVDTDPGEGNATPMSFGSGSLSATIGTSLAPGLYNVCVRARDAAGNWSEPSCAILVVYDPSAGFATGGGWFVPGGNTSDPGDLLPGLDGTSKANFGFVVKYKNGTSTVPSGNLEFHYNVGGFHLRSTGMDWLVVTNSNWAKFRGVASIDGATGEYPFNVDARDGSPDRFVIKIWAPGANPDTDSPIYKASGDVEGGQVKIHRS